MPYIPRALNLAPNTDGDPTYRMSMLPFGTYANPDGSGEHLGFAVPGAIQEPLNALARLFGTPSHPGTFGQGPDAPGNADAMRTLLMSMYGGNATGGLAREAAALPSLRNTAQGLYRDFKYADEPAPVLRDNVITGAEYAPPVSVHPAFDPPPMTDILERGAANDTLFGTLYDHPPFDGSYGNSLIDQTRKSFRPSLSVIDGDLLSDTGKPSLMGSAVAGTEGNTSIRGFRGSNQARPTDAPRAKYWASTSPDVASGYATSPYGFDAPNVTPANFSFENPMTVDAGGSYWAQIPHNGGMTTTDNLARLAETNGHDGLIVRNVLDEMAGNGMPADSILALKRGTVTSPMTGETLFSDGLPSLFGSALYQDQEPRNALLTY